MGKEGVRCSERKTSLLKIQKLQVKGMETYKNEDKMRLCMFKGKEGRFG